MISPFYPFSILLDVTPKWESGLCSTIWFILLIIWLWFCFYMCFELLFNLLNLARASLCTTFFFPTYKYSSLSSSFLAPSLPLISNCLSTSLMSDNLILNNSIKNGLSHDKNKNSPSDNAPQLPSPSLWAGCLDFSPSNHPTASNPTFKDKVKFGLGSHNDLSSVATLPESSVHLQGSGDDHKTLLKEAELAEVFCDLLSNKLMNCQPFVY